MSTALDMAIAMRLRGGICIRWWLDEGVEAALDAALADLGGLDGLAVLVNVAASDFATEKRLNAKLTADRDRLRDALRQVVERAGEHWGPLDLALDGAETALRESEAGT